MKHPLKNFKKRIGWYPVTTFGWFVTSVYFALLAYVVFKINQDLYATNIAIFYGSMLIVGIIVVILLWARITRERPFAKK